MVQRFALVLAAAATAFAAGCADTRQPGMHHGMQGMHGMMHGNTTGDPGSQALQQQMMRGMHQMHGMQMSGDVDRDFVQMMRQHHIQGIEMARIELQRGDNAEAKRMAQKIIDEQQKDVARFDAWLQAGSK